MPKRGPDPDKLDKIIKVLKHSGRRGIWMRELARQANLPFTTVHYYLNNYLQNDIVIKDMEFELAKSDKFKIVRLKEFA